MSKLLNPEAHARADRQSVVYHLYCIIKPMDAVIDYTVSGFSEEPTALVMTYPAIENVAGGMITRHD